MALERYLTAEQELEAARWALLKAANAREGRSAAGGHDDQAATSVTQAVKPGVATDQAG